ncbi:MAG: hypothetical protein ACLP7Q_18450 [Isosphaeraceae bacterium]
MTYKFCTYAVIVFGGTISGALLGTVTGPINIHLSVDSMGTLGAGAGAFMAVLGCMFALEQQQAAVRNREIFRILEGRLSRVVQHGPELHTD